MSHQRFGEIRSLLHQHAPSEELWNRLTQLLWGWRDLLPEEMMASYSNGVLSDWPDALRILPKAWLRAILRGEDHALFSICRHLPLSNKQITREKLATICATGHLAPLTMLDLSSNRMATKFNDLDWLETLSTAPFLCALTHLRLGHCWLDAAALSKLATLDMPALRLLDLSSNMRLNNLPHFFEHFSARDTIEVLELGWDLTSEAANRRYDYYREGPELYSDYLRPSHLVQAIHHLPALRELNLYRSSCGPEFIIENETLLCQLDTLHVGVEFDNEAWCQAIRESIALRELRALYLSHLSHDRMAATVDALIDMKHQQGCKLEVLGLPFYCINHLRAYPSKGAMLEGVEIVQVD